MKNIFKLFWLFFIPLFLIACSEDDDNAYGDADLEVTKLAVNDIKASDVPALFAKNGIIYHPIDKVCWAESFPYAPKAAFAIAHTGNSLLVHYKVTEHPVLGNIAEDNGSVWQESCVELFASMPGESEYYNIEVNCLGYALQEVGTSRNDREMASLSNLKQIDRWASLGSKPVGRIDSETSWEVALVVPIQAFWQTKLQSFDNALLKGNIYHCIGSGDERCYLTWKPISTPKPDFHQPSFFGTIHCQ